MRDEVGFEWTVEELNGPEYRLKALDTDKESSKFYPGLEKLDFHLYTFKLTSQ
jgi:hypothetical protein